MAEEKLEAQTENTETTTDSEFTEVTNERPTRGRRNDRGRRGTRRRSAAEDDGFDKRIITVRRVSRMYKGGRRMRLSVFVVIGDKNGKVGVGMAKAADVSSAQIKAIAKAKKHLIDVTRKGNTIPHDTLEKFRATQVLIKPAAPGTGLVAGASVKSVLELAGIKDALTKVIGSTNPINTAYATIQALQALRDSRK